MTIDEEAKQIRSELGRHKPGRGRRHPRALRRRILSWLDRAQEAGRLITEAGRAIGVDLARVEKWRESERRVAQTVPKPAIPEVGSSAALVPVALRDELPFGPGITFATPSGHRIEGLTLEQALGLLRAHA